MHPVGTRRRQTWKRITDLQEPEPQGSLQHLKNSDVSVSFSYLLVSEVLLNPGPGQIDNAGFLVSGATQAETCDRGHRKSSL